MINFTNKFQKYSLYGYYKFKPITFTSLLCNNCISYRYIIQTTRYCSKMVLSWIIIVESLKSFNLFVSDYFQYPALKHNLILSFNSKFIYFVCLTHFAFKTCLIFKKKIKSLIHNKICLIFNFKIH